MTAVDSAVADYIAHHRREASRELEYFSRVLRSDDEAVSRAALSSLGFDGRRHTIEMHELPVPIRKLTAREAEGLLCIYKSRLR